MIPHSATEEGLELSFHLSRISLDSAIHMDADYGCHAMESTMIPQISVLQHRCE
jgi:hypothetical protein